MSSAKTASELLARGDCYTVDGCYAEALESYDACLAATTDDDDTTSPLRFRALSHKSGALFYLRRNQEALEAAQQAVRVYKEQQQDTCMIASLATGELEACRRREWKAAVACGDKETAKMALLAAQKAAALHQRPTERYDTALAKMEAGSADRKSNADHMMGRLSGAPSAATKPTAKTKSSPPTTKSTTESGKTPATRAVDQLDDAVPSTASSSLPANASVGIADDATTTTRPAVEPRSLTQHPLGSAPAPTTGTASSALLADAPKYQYYQSDKVMTVCILEPNVKEEDLYVEVEAEGLLVTMRKNQKIYSLIDGTLFSEVDVPKCKLTIKDEKVLVKLRKEKPHEWHELLSAKKKPRKAAVTTAASATVEAAATAPPTADNTTKKNTPYASHRDWNAIEKNIDLEEKKSKPEGEDAMNSLFQSIFAGADDDTKRAMMKSYQTSGGTVLSTNWDEVSKKDYEKERVAPKGMEWKNWEGKKLAMEEDD